jgi:WD40 repeat protein/DNA-binding SARP family transcriptional activator
MLQIRLLGQFDTRLDGKRVTIPTRAAQSLLAYLVLTAGTPHRREKLAGIFWPETSDENARKNLRQELWRIRKSFSAQGSSEKDYFLADELTLTFNRDADYWLDVAQIERPDTDLQSLTTNLALYQGELLPGFYDEWIGIERERVQSIFEARMAQLLEQLITNERWVAVEEWAERWLALSGAREPAYRALMLASGARGDMAKVASLYQRCTDELLEQLGVEPSAETRALYDGLLKGARAPRTSMQPSGTITFLFTDIEGSTRLLEKLGDQYSVALDQHHEILRAAIRKWDGHEVDTQGDAFFVTFGRAINAVQCAAEAQRALAAHPWIPGAPLRVRMGLHTGEPLIASTGYVGMDVHRAARIGDVGHGGQVLLSQTTRDLIIQDLPRGLSIRDLGEHRLKDMKYPAPIYQLVIDGLPVGFPALKTKFTGLEAPTPGEPPFKGLQYFDEEDSDLFFGREVLTAKLVQRLRETHFLSVVIGASGSGKSSLVRAGLIPALKKGDPLLDGTRPPKDSTQWHIHIMTPTAHPLEALSTELTRESESVTATATLLDDLMREPRSLSLFLTRKYPKAHTLLVIDQFEELFTLCRDEFEREAFIDNLLSAVTPEKSHISLIVTLRADFYAHLSQYPELRELVARHQEYIGPMAPEELRRAMEEPARRGHWEFEPGLVDLILRDVGDEPGALPLLSHALLETWKRRAGHTLTLKGYADAGGVHGAIAHTAESVYQHLSEEEQTTARNIFLRLTELGEGTEDTRRRASFAELISQEGDAGMLHSVLNILADARLVTLSEDTAEVAHEALIREWPSLREWLNQDREGLRLHRHLTEAAREWELLGRDPGALYRGAHLAQAGEWAALNPNPLNVAERAFLNASLEQERHDQREREERQQRELEAAQKLAETERARAEEQTQAADRLRLRNRLITVVGVTALALALLAGAFGWQSRQNARQAETNLAIADQQRVAAQDAQATAVVESQVRATQQAIAEANFRQAEAQRLAAEASNLIAAQGHPELIALLSLRSLNTQYSIQGDAALTAATRLGYPEQIFNGDTLGPVYAVAFSPDNKYVLTGETSTATLWNASTGEKIRTFPRDLWVGNPILSVAYSPDGKYILTGSGEGTARLLDVTTGEQVHKFLDSRGAIFSMTFSPDGNTLLTGSLDGIARLWDTVTGKELHRFFSQANPVGSVAFSPDGKTVLLGHGDGTAGLWDVQTGTEMRQFRGHSGSINALAFSPDGKLILTAGSDRTVRLWDAATGKELQRFIGHADNIWSVAFSPDGKYAFTSSNDGTARKWDPQSGQELQRYTDTQEVSRMAVSPDGKLLVTSNSIGEARLWRINPAPKLPIFKNSGIVNGVAFSPNGESVLTGDSNGVVSLWDSRTGEKLRDFEGHTAPIGYGVAFSPDGKYALTGSWDHTVRLWNRETGEELRQFIGPKRSVNSVAFSPDGKFVSSGGGDGLWLWETETGKKVRHLTMFPDQVSRVAFSPDGKYVATVEGDDEIDENSRARVWEVSTGKLRFSTPGFSALNSITFSPDGKHILTTNADNAAWLWDIQMNKEILQFSGHTASIWTATFSPDGNYVATASEDSTVRLWDAQTGQELRRFIGHGASVENVVFSPDGKYLLTGSGDGTAMLWDVDYQTTIQYLCSVLRRDFTDEERAQYNITDKTPTCPRP